ncbi:hypothetical protein HXX76_004072 [Chlamydomonas incerta]|uniref:Uncharacterized protein n=1 Tax=Chlamydomonas incerta TaxID=51695 RepID=A0A835TB81_CHLIN|nr:hypothetical protein HXX76_004072 [Chlamydomonas incerta]|eukprot:KAG2439953.1 hypothetical protein HXX76_004072 [Chlamydomonas incerta]
MLARPTLTLQSSRCCTARQAPQRVMLVRASPESSAPKDADKHQATSSSQNTKKGDVHHGDNKKTDNHKGAWNPPFKSLEPHEPLPVEDRKTNIDM